MRKLFIIKTGSTFPDTARQYGDFDVWTCDALGINREETCVVDVEQGAALPSVEACSGVVVTGSHAMVTDNLPWSMDVASWIPSLLEAEVPFLGICYGHQLLAHAMGGLVGSHPGGKEIGTVDVHILPEGLTDPLFRSLPLHFPAHVSHSQTVLSLPPGAVRLAANSFEPIHAFKLGKRAWGVQFHPEYEVNVMKSYILNQADELKAIGRDVSEILSTVRGTSAAKETLRRFAHIVQKGQ